MKKVKNCLELNHSYTKASTRMVEFDFEDFKTKKKASGSLDLIYVVFPSGLDGYRLELDGEDIGTVFYNPKEKEWRMVNW
jgi:hypothetical protein